jgi:hypothetical protein
MNLYAYLIHAQIRADLDSPESAKRRERLRRYELEAREQSRRRKRELARRAWTTLRARGRRESRELRQRIDALDPRESVR